jgi:hypothetical protein
MSISDCVEIIVGIATIYFLRQQNEIFKRQNAIFAAQTGVAKASDERPTWARQARRYWPMLAMAMLTILTWAAIGYEVYDRHRRATQLANNPASAAPIGSGNVPVPIVPPNFVLSIPGANIFIPDQAKNLTGIALDVSIRNSGAPSPANDWKLWIAPGKNLHPALAQLTTIPESLAVGGPINSTVIRAAQSLVDKTHNTPINTGEVIDGKLLFYTTLPKSRVQSDSTVLELSTEDISGKEFTVKQRMADWLKR